MNKYPLLIAACLAVSGCNTAPPDLHTQLIFNAQCQPLGGEFQMYAASQMLANPELKNGMEDAFKRIMIERIQTGEARWCDSVRSQIKAEGRWL